MPDSKPVGAKPSELKTQTLLAGLAKRFINLFRVLDPKFTESLHALPHEEVSYIEFFNEHAGHGDMRRLYRRMIESRKESRTIRIPDPERFIESTYPSIKIDLRKFWKEFDRLNAVSDAPAPAPPPPPSDEVSRHLDGLIGSVPKGGTYAETADTLAGMGRDFRRRIAVEVAPALNAHVRAMPQDTYEEKKAIATWVNDEVKRFGLAVKCPKTGLPAKLRAQTGNWPGIGRFSFEVYIDGKRTNPSASDKLPELQLIDAIPAQGRETPDLGSETPWQDEVGPKSTRRGRKLD